MTKEGSTIIVNFMTRVGVVLGCGLIGDIEKILNCINLLLYSYM